MTIARGAVPLARLIVRRDRIRLAIWVVAIPLALGLFASGIRNAYPDAESLGLASAAIERSRAQVALNAPAVGLDTLGGRVAFELSNFGLISIAIMSILIITRHTTQEVQRGRMEIVRAMPVGASAPIVAAASVLTVANLVIGAGTAVILAIQGLSAEGSVILGSGLAATGIFFGAVALVAAQHAPNGRVAAATAGVCLAAAFSVRAVGDVRDSAVSWASPIGWAQASQPFVGNRLWPLILLLALAALLAGYGVAASLRRDIGAGWGRSRTGPSTASRRLASPFALVLRVERTALLAWTAGATFMGSLLGTMAPDVNDIAGDAAARAVFGGSVDLTDGFFAAMLFLLALIGGGFAVQLAMRLQNLEDSGRLELLLAGPVPRMRWAIAQLSIAAIGSALVLTAAGLGAGLSYGALTGDLDHVPRLLGSALSYAPALWVMSAVTMALFGIAPRLSWLAWVLFGGAVAVGMFGLLLDLPRWVTELSPFEHVPRLPAADADLTGPAALVGVALVLAGLGIGAFQRRSVG